eukprot:Stramenopile-MAST_4_protein_4629
MDKTQCAGLSTNNSRCINIRFVTKSTEWGNRTTGLCVTAAARPASAEYDDLHLAECSLGDKSQTFALAAGPLSGYRMHSALTHACVTIQTFKDPFIRGIETLQLNAPVRLKACNAMGSAYQSFKLPYVESECGETESPYISSDETIARHDHSAVMATNTVHSMGSRGAKMVVFGGWGEKAGYLGDVWEYDVDRKQWAEIFDGKNWMRAEDAHLHAQPMIYKHLKAGATATRVFLDDPASATLNLEDHRPLPRSGHTATMVYYETKSTVTKSVPILVERTFRDPSFIDQQRVVFDIGSLLFAQDRETRPNGVGFIITEARRREATWWSKSKASNWDGYTYPYDFVHTDEGSNVYNWTITLLSNTSLRLRRPAIRRTVVTDYFQRDNFTKVSVKLDYTYEESHIYTCLNMTYICRTSDADGCATCGGNQFTDWNPQGESYVTEEKKTQTVTATSVSKGMSRMLVFGGWVRSGQKAYISAELWAYDRGAQLTMSTGYNADVYDSVYNTFPCCGSVQECCGTAMLDTFHRCKSRRNTNVSTCVGALPAINMWSMLKTHESGSGKPAARYGHTAVNLGGKTSFSPTRDRL